MHRMTKKIIIKWNPIIILTIALSVGIPMVYAESEYGDLTQSRPDLVAKYQAKADAEFQAQSQAGLQSIIDKANAGGYRVTVVGPDNQGTIYGNNLPPEDARAVDVRNAAQDVANLEQHLLEHRQGVEQFKEWNRQIVMSGREAINTAPSNLDKDQLNQAQEQSEKSLHEVLASVDKSAAEHEAKIKTEIENRREQLRVLVSMEKGKN